MGLLHKSYILMTNSPTVMSNLPMNFLKSAESCEQLFDATIFQQQKVLLKILKFILF